MAVTANSRSIPADAIPHRPNPVLLFIRKEPLGFAGFLIILLYFVFALGARWIAPFDPEAVDFAAMLSPPSAEHFFGTDQYGRDVFSRLVYGARTALGVGILSAFLGCTAGAVLGAASGYFGGRIDNVIQRIVDILLSFPIIVLAMVVVAVLGKNVVLGIDFNLIVAIALPMVLRMARIARSSTLSIAQMPFIDAARAAGYGHARIVLRHILPNIVAPYLIMVTAFIAQAILLEASLSFLGLGVTEPTPAWGLMLSGTSADFYKAAPWMILFPGLAITLAVFAFNLFGDSLRDWLDPKMKG
ncbi:MAG TPA: ABC transporter permease [Hyphomicrobiaceae bacterium]|jgi:peptide/nickel transport system permease protein|nr:ABC transporter permease [Hyphomicrobiaceae bacterium]